VSQRLGQVARRLLRAPTRLYDWHAGWLLGPRFVRLTHVGRRTGRHHRTILETIGTDREVDELLVLVGMGPTADWYRNIQKHPALELATMRRRFRPVLAEREAVLALAEYERRNRWALFVIRPMLSWLPAGTTTAVTRRGCVSPSSCRSWPSARTQRVRGGQFNSAVI
jgi:deazaflavin-dependent oxidoreductase (nitroreductase family)